MYDSNAPLDHSYGTGPSLSSADAANLRNAGKWARFIAIVAMVGIGIFLFTLIVGGSSMAASMGLGDGAGIGLVVLLIYGALMVFSLYLMYLQYQFGNHAMQAVDRSDGSALSQSLAALGRYYKITGVIMAIYLVLLAVGILFAILGGAMSFLF